MKILVADDSRFIRATITAHLDPQEFEVIEASTGTQALEYLQSGYVSLAVLDWHMPGVSGVDICRRLAGHAQRAKVYIIIITAQGGLHSLAEAFEAGCQDYITKPFSKTELLARVRAGKQIITLQSQLAQSQKLESIGQLAAGISHEINTPIQYVGDNLRFLQDAFKQLWEMVDPEKRRSGESQSSSSVPGADIQFLIDEVPAAIEQSLEGVDRVASIVRAMKEFAHPGNVEKTPVDLHKTIENTLIVSANEWKYYATIHRDFAPDMPLVPCVVSEINQVFLNLIVNAAHAISDVVGPHQRTKGVITVRTRHDGKDAIIEIADTGCGIKPEHRERIFDPFFTSKEVGRGTGQGLTIAHSVVVTKHKGNITFTTELGKGTTFRIKLPLSRREPPPPEPRSPIPSKLPSTSVRTIPQVAHP